MEVQDDDIPQNQAISGDQVQNSAGGFVYKVDDMNRLRRFLCLGSEGGTFYIGEKVLGLENAQTIAKLIDENKGEEVVKELVDFSVEGRAAKQNPIIFTLAYCARQNKNKEVKRLAYQSVNKVCRIPTHLFSFVDYSEKLSGDGSGWGRAHRRAISQWYLQHKENPMKLAMHVTKYKNRNGWSHKDVLRLSHPKPEAGNGVDAIVKYVIKGVDVAKAHYEKDAEVYQEKFENIFSFLKATEVIKKKTPEDIDEVVKMIEDHKLVHEHIPTKLLNHRLIWRALLQKMPLTAMIRNLSKMSAVELLVDNNDEVQLVCEKLRDTKALKDARIHPFNVLVALHTYRKGRGDKGKLKWKPCLNIVRELDETFYRCFKFVEPTNQRYCLAIDVSGSMSWGGVNGCPVLNPRDASGALSLVTARTEKSCDFVAFSTEIMPIHVNPDESVEKFTKNLSNFPMGGTDCAQPMLWAAKKNKKYDVFIVYTDCETWAGAVHPAEALRQYRRDTGIWTAKLIVCAMTSNSFTLADPEDPGMLDMAGFDASGPQIMKNFVTGKI